jgi:hypothetical protein
MLMPSIPKKASAGGADAFFEDISKRELVFVET